MATLGIHWIATTFGTWLHGDPRGSWRDGKLIGPDPFLEAAIQARMTANAVVLIAEETTLLATIFGQAITEHGWPVYAATIHPTHVHIVFAPMRDDIATVIVTLKKRSANAVMEHRRKQEKAVGRSLWTEGQFTRFLFDHRHLENAVAYVQEHNLRVGLQADPYPWVGHVPPW